MASHTRAAYGGGGNRRDAVLEVLGGEDWRNQHVFDKVLSAIHGENYKHRLIERSTIGGWGKGK